MVSRSRGTFRLEAPQRHRVLGQHQGQRLEGGGRPERRPARQQIVKDGPQRIHVGRRAEGLDLALGLFGRHVGRGAHDDPGLGLPGLALELLGQAEVGDLEDTLFQGRVGLAAQQHVGRLEVAVQNAVGVGGVHGPRQGLDQLRRLQGVKGGAVKAVGETAALDVFQREEGLAVGLPDIVDLHDVRVLQPRHRLGFPAKTLQLLRAGVGPGADHLQGDHALQPQVPGLVDDPHAATP